MTYQSKTLSLTLLALFAAFCLGSEHYELQYSFTSETEGIRYLFKTGIVKDGKGSTGNTTVGQLTVEFLYGLQQQESFLTPVEREPDEKDFELYNILLAADRIITPSEASEYPCLGFAFQNGFLPPNMQNYDHSQQVTADSDHTDASDILQYVGSMTCEDLRCHKRYSDTCPDLMYELMTKRNLGWLGVRNYRALSPGSHVAYIFEKGCSLFHKLSHRMLESLFFELFHKADGSESKQHHYHLEIMKQKIAEWIDLP